MFFALIFGCIGLYAISVQVLWILRLLGVDILPSWVWRQRFNSIQNNELTNSIHSNNSFLNSSHSFIQNNQINPASGLPCFGGVDVAGNPIGTNNRHL